MRVIADLHIHSRYSRATSERMTVKELDKYARIKGLNVLGSGDFTHPLWLNELKDSLIPTAHDGTYSVKDNPGQSVLFILTAEVSTIFTFNNEVRKVHHVILAPDFNCVEQINDRLRKYGNLSSDGRPTLSMSAPQLVEEVMHVSISNMVFPAHVWTPWFSLFGAFSGFNSVDECYQDMTKHIHALETGLSSDPPMNWRLSSLDRFALVSNSDSHSFWPWRIGREANVFELEHPSYSEILGAIRDKNPRRFCFTIETDPAYGKYHWTGHRNCKVSLSAKEASKLNNICPVCRRKLTKGVEQRVDELADRPAGFKAEGKISFRRLLPLSEIIAAVVGADSPATQKVWNIYNPLIDKFGNEYSVLLDASRADLANVAGEKITDVILRVRNGEIMVIPGFDGVYGRLVVSDDSVTRLEMTDRVRHHNLLDFL